MLEVWYRKETSSVIIADRCHSWMVDPDADFSIMSFYPCKLVPGAEGGAVICKREEDAEALRLWLYCGLRPGSAGNGDLPVVPGRKSNMTDVTAALNLEALELAPKYMQAVDEAWTVLSMWADALEVPYRKQPARPYLFQVDLIEDLAEFPGVLGLREHLKCVGIASAWNFRPAPLVTLPCFPGMTVTEAETVIKAAKECL